MFNTDPAQRWSLSEKIAFRFLFLFLGFFLLSYEFAFAMIDFGLFRKLAPAYSIFNGPLHWLDRHIYHTGYDPGVHMSIPGDNHFGAVLFITFIILFAIVTVIWSITDSKRLNYYRLNYWFRVFVRYMVALIMIGYGVDKLVPLQMSYPQVTDLLTPFGEQDRFTMIWNFIGASPGYQIFAGIAELIAALLLLFRRTSVAGSLLMCGVLSNVVALNLFYGIPVKLYSSLLLVSDIYLLLPFAGRLFQFFFKARPVSLTEPRYLFESKWKKYVIAALVSIPLINFVQEYYSYDKVYRKVLAGMAAQKLYDVDYFVSNDSLPPLLTDTLRWKRFVFNTTTSAAVYNMRDNAEFFDCDMDTLKSTCRLHNNPDSTKWDVFHYSYPKKGKMLFTGAWKGKQVSILFNEVPVDSMKLNKERIAGISFYKE